MFFKILLGGALFLVMQTAMALNIVATVPPLASMVNPLLTERDSITTLLTPGHTPHGFQLKPSHMLALERADIILTIGTGVDNWAAKAVARWPEKVISMVELPGLVKLKMRSQSDWKISVMDKGKDGHSHDHGHKHHHHKHSHKGVDPHMWLSPDNAALLIVAFTETYLQTIENENDRADFKVLSQEYLANLKKVDLKIKQQLAPISQQAYVVLHDAFQYFQAHYNLNGVGAIQISPILEPSIKRVLKMQEIIKDKEVVCVFKEPQFPARQVEYLVRGMDVRIGSLDPLGGRVENERYDEFLQILANQFESCLK